MSHPVHDPKTKMLSGRRVLGLAGVIVCVLVIKAFVQADNPRARAEQVSQDRMDRQVKQFGKRLDSMLMNDSAIQATVSGLSDSEASEKLNELSSLGVRRLNSEDQVRWISLFAAMYDATPDNVCAGEDLPEMLGGLDSTNFEEFMTLKFAAMQAEIQGTSPTLRTDSTAVAQARQTAINSLTPAERKKFDSLASSTAKCALVRFFYGRISTLPESLRANYARAMTTIEAAAYDAKMRMAKQQTRFISPRS